MPTDKISTLDNVFDDIEIPLKTSLAWNGEARSNKEIHNIVLKVKMSGVSLKKLVDDALAQGAVKFQRTRRAKDSGGVFETREAFDEYLETLGSEHEVHFSALGHSPANPQKAEESFDASVASMTEEQIERKIAELQAKMGKKGKK